MNSLTSFHGSAAFIPPPLLSHNSCNQTLRFCHAENFVFPKKSPLYKCLFLIWNGQIDYECFPLQYMDESAMPFLTSNCKMGLWLRLTTKIAMGSKFVTPLQWLYKLITLSAGQDWIYWWTDMVGSGIPTTDAYWRTYLLALGTFPPETHERISRAFSSKNKQWSNLDVVIRVQLGTAPDVRDRFEETVKFAVYQLVQKHMTGTEVHYGVTGPIRIGNTGSIFTISDGTHSFDLFVYYAAVNQPLPVLFTQQGLCIPIHNAITSKFEVWPPMQPRTVEVSPSKYFVDRFADILCYQASKLVGNFGMLKKFLLMMTKGSLGIQTGLSKWLLSTYMNARPDADHPAFDAFQSYREHLPNTLGALLCHWLHWMGAMQKVSQFNAQHILANKLVFNDVDKAEEHLQKTYYFIKQYPTQFRVLVMALEYVMLLGYLYRPGVHVTCGMWEGKLDLRLQMEKGVKAFFQYRLNPQKSLSKIYNFLRAENIDPALKAETIQLIQAFLDTFQINRDSREDTEVLRQYKLVGLDEISLHLVWNRFEKAAAPAPSMSVEVVSTPVEESNEPEIIEVPVLNVIPSVQQSTRMSLEQLVENKDWPGVKKRLFLLAKKTIPSERIIPVGEAVWSLFEAWAMQWRHGFPSKESRQAMIKLLFGYTSILQQTGSENRSAILRDMLVAGFKEQRRIKILINHRENKREVLHQKHSDEIAIAIVDKCFDGTLLNELHKLVPGYVLEHILKHLTSNILPPEATLVALIQTLRGFDAQRSKAEEPAIARKLILSDRSAELPMLKLSFDINGLYEGIFGELISCGDLVHARKILDAWKTHSKLPLAEQEFELYNREGKKRSVLDSIKGAISIWNTYQANQNVAPQTRALCLDLVMQNADIDAETLKQLWPIFKTGGVDALKNIPVEQWNSIIAKMEKNTSFSSLWEALFYLVEIKRHWEEPYNDILKLLLDKALKSTGKNRARDGRNQHLIPILNHLHGRVRWENHLERNEGLTALVIKNLSVIAKQQKQNTTARQLGRAILQGIKGCELSTYDWQTYMQIHNEFENIKLMPRTHWISKNCSALQLFVYEYYWTIILFSLVSVLYIQYINLIKDDPQEGASPSSPFSPMFDIKDSELAHLGEKAVNTLRAHISNSLPVSHELIAQTALETMKPIKDLIFGFFTDTGTIECRNIDDAWKCVMIEEFCPAYSDDTTVYF